jgi:hypothetical protein
MKIDFEEKEQKMKTDRRLFYPVVLLLLVAFTGGALWWCMPALGASTTTTMTVPISGIVNGPTESVYLAGLVQITSNVTTASTVGTPTGAPPVVLFIDFTKVTGRGLLTGATYVSNAQSMVVRPLAVLDVVEVAFPFFPSRLGGLLSARSALATFSLTYNVTAGQLTAGTAVFRTPNF